MEYGTRWIKPNQIKKIRVIIVSIIVIVNILLILVLAYPRVLIKTMHFWYGDLMGEKKVCERWGEQALDVKKFKLAGEDSSLRAKMTCSLIKNKQKFIGKNIGEIRKLFGSYDGHYFIDLSPAYLIEIASKREQDSWQIVFLIDRHEKISDIFVHRNCCH